MINLPTQKREFAKRKNPKRLVIFSKPKAGKTTMVGLLNNTLILDLEDGGADHLSNVMAVNVIGLTPPGKEVPELKKKRLEAGRYYLLEIVNEIKRLTKENKGIPPYQKVALDTVTQLELWCEDYATVQYMQSTQGKSFNRKSGKVLPKNQWDSVLTLPNGAGYLWLRIAFMQWLDLIDKIAPDIILIAHLKDKLINKAGKEVNAMDLNLTGRISQMLAASSDAIGYVYRKRDNTYINFKGGDDTCGSRCAHLKGQDILIMEEEDGHIVRDHWDKIYLDDVETTLIPGIVHSTESA